MQNGPPCKGKLPLGVVSVVVESFLVVIDSIMCGDFVLGLCFKIQRLVLFLVSQP